MPRYLALEWDVREARVAVARARGRDVEIEHAFTVDLLPRDSGQTFADVNVGKQIAAELAARNTGRCETLVAVGRASIELRRLSVPPAPPDELPDMVRFQALRQFTGIGEDWPLDFVPLDSGDPESFSVLAAAISPEIVEQIRATCQAGGLVPRRLVFRPFAAASLLRRRDRTPQQPCRLLVDLLADEADLTVVVDDQVALVRTIRLPTPDVAGTPSRALVGEIRRTLAAAHNQLRDRRVEKVILFGHGEEQAAQKALIEQDLEQEVETFDPFSQMRLGDALRRQKPEHPGRFAPLLGMLLDEAAGAGHAMDFLHPRRRTEPPNRRLRFALVGAGVAAMIALIGLTVWWKLATLDGEIAALAEQTRNLKKSVEQAEKKRAAAAAIGEFLESDISWLDELHRLSSELPSAEEMILTQLTTSTRLPKGGQVILDGYTQEHDQIFDVGEKLRGPDRQVVSTGGQYDERRETYHWRFKETVLIDPRTELTNTLQEKPPAEKPAPGASAEARRKNR